MSTKPACTQPRDQAGHGSEVGWVGPAGPEQPGPPHPAEAAATPLTPVTSQGKPETENCM